MDKETANIAKDIVQSGEQTKPEQTFNQWYINQLVAQQSSLEIRLDLVKQMLKKIKTNPEVMEFVEWSFQLAPPGSK